MVLEQFIINTVWLKVYVIKQILQIKVAPARRSVVRIREIQEEVVCAAPFPVSFQKHCTSDIKELRQDIKDTQGNVEKKEKAHKKRIYKD